MSGNVQTGVELTYMSFSFVQNADANVVMSLECSVSFFITMKQDIVKGVYVFRVIDRFLLQSLTILPNHSEPLLLTATVE